jgi:hypothetical protein
MSINALLNFTVHTAGPQLNRETDVTREVEVDKLVPVTDLLAILNYDNKLRSVVVFKFRYSMKSIN